SALSFSSLYAHSTISSFMWGLAICGAGFGLLVVPLNTILQQRTSADKRGQLFAICGIMGSFAMLLGFGSAMFLSTRLSESETLKIFFFIAATVTTFSCYAYRYQITVLPLLWLQRFCYKVDVVGEHNIPLEGGCLIVCNHVSYSDGAILGSNLPRHAKFLVYESFTKIPVIGFILRAIGVIPIKGDGKRQALVSSINAAVDAAKAGEAVVIFPEGKLSRSGQLDSFQRGMERIAQRAGVPVIPAYLEGLFGTVSSRASYKKHIRPRRPVRLRIGEALPPDISAAQARHAILRLQYEDAVDESKRDTRTLGIAYLQSTRRNPFKTAIHEESGDISYLKAAACACKINDSLSLTANEKNIGILLPPGRGGAMVNIAMAIDGRCAVNLNHTVGIKSLQYMCSCANLKTIITSKLYMRHIKIDPDDLATDIVYIEDVLKSLKLYSILWKMLLVLCIPPRFLCNGTSDDVAAIIFSSGSTGTPKAVQLTHRNFIANGKAARSHLELDPRNECILCPLPLFHSFGLGVGIWLPLANGLTCALQADPRDGAAISKLCLKSQATILVSTPTFIRSYMRRMDSDELKTLRSAVVGAEKCPADLLVQFKEKFNADVLEGYGCTELCPFVASNISNTHKDGVVEKGSREGSIGRALPG
ncbi:MAG: AMP-binding protein, partial [Planctomycetes bacterium]|nr:AMP-binding protein [Planctomycetota bacterium]